jgi:hypothetical protein
MTTALPDATDALSDTSTPDASSDASPDVPTDATDHDRRRTGPRRARRLARRGPALLAALVLVAAACGGDDDDTSAAGGSDAGGGGGGEMAAEIVSPADGDTIDPNFDLELSSTEEIGEPDTGLLHYHVFIDGDEEDYEIVYENTHTVERDLSAGEHTIEAALANPDHSLVDGATRDEMTVTVGEGGGTGGGGSDDSESDTTSGGGYDY